MSTVTFSDSESQQALALGNEGQGGGEQTFGAGSEAGSALWTKIQGMPNPASDPDSIGFR